MVSQPSRTHYIAWVKTDTDVGISNTEKYRIPTFYNVRYSFLLCNSNFVFKMRCCFDIQLKKCCDLKTGFGSVKVTGNVTKL